MKGAIGNALILNIVITFITIFYALLIGSMAYSKAYRTKDYILNEIDEFENRGEWINVNAKQSTKWDIVVNEHLQKIGYPISTGTTRSCESEKKYPSVVIKNEKGRYDYCILKGYEINEAVRNKIIKERYNYKVVVYMKFDLPVIGSAIKIPIKGETKQYVKYR
jgi:hypothetical protein